MKPQGSDAEHLLSRKDGIGLVLALLLEMGAICPDCGYSTYIKSKQWAVCKNCGRRVERKDGGVDG